MSGDTTGDGDRVAADASEPRPYSASRRTRREHKRVVFHGTERFDADGVKLEPGDMRTEQQREADDDKRILGELHPTGPSSTTNVECGDHLCRANSETGVAAAAEQPQLLRSDGHNRTEFLCVDD